MEERIIKALRVLIDTANGSSDHAQIIKKYFAWWYDSARLVEAFDIRVLSYLPVDLIRYADLLLIYIMSKNFAFMDEQIPFFQEIEIIVNQYFLYDDAHKTL